MVGATVVPRRITSQPQYAAGVDRGNPITRGLVNLYSRGFDAATNKLVPASDAGQQVSRSIGTSLSLSGTNYVDLGTAIGTTGPITFLAVFTSTGTTADSLSDIIAQGDRCTLRLNTSIGQLEFYTYDGAAWQQTNLPGIAQNLPTVAVVVHDQAAGVNRCYGYQAGVLSGSSIAASPRSTGAHNLRIGLDDETSRSIVGVVSLGAAFNRALTDAEVRALIVNPWQLFQPPAQSIRFALGAPMEAYAVPQLTLGKRTRRRSSIYDYSRAGWFDSQLVSTAAAFDHDFVTSASGRTGASHVTLAAATVAAAGKVDLAAQASRTLAAATLSATGTVTLSGATASTLSAATVAAAGAVALSGTASTTLGAATVAAAGTVALSGATARTLADVAASAAGTVALSGAAAPTLAALTSNAAGTVALAGATSQTLAGATSAATGALALVGSSAPTLAPATLAAVSALGPIVGVADTVLADATLVASSTAAIAGAATTTLAGVATTASGTIALSGAGALALADATLLAAAVLALSGAETSPLADATLTAAGVLALDASAAPALDDATLEAAGELTAFGTILGVLDAALGDAAVAASAGLAVGGSSSLALQSLSVSAAGHVDIASALGITFGDATLAGSAVAVLAGAADVALADLVLVAAATLRTNATQLSAQHAAWLEGLARLHGLVDPFAVGPTLRGDGTVVQQIAEAAGVVTLTTIAAPTGDSGPSALDDQQAGWLEALARLHGLVDPLQVTATQRGDGTLLQSISVTGATVLVERLQ